MIKNFQQFLNESENKDFSVSDIFSSLSRNYETNKKFYTDELQFNVEQERKDWGDIRKKAELEKTNTEQADYKLVFRMDEKRYVLELEFSFDYTGKKEKDAPETASVEDLARLNTVLNSVKIEHISLKSSTLDYNTSKPSSSVLRACEKFVIKMMSSDYDTLGEEIATLEQ